jgi:hypothetical protein
MQIQREMRVEIDLAGTIRSKRERGNFSLQNALLELIDNSVDEGAQVVTIRQVESDLIIEDDGGGFEDIQAALIVGKSSKEKKIGRFGVGLKDASIRYSDTTVIESNGKRVSVPWSKIANGVHDGNIGLPEKTKRDGKTRIILKDFRRIYKGAIQTEDIRRTYQPLIKSGAIRIEVDGTEQKPLPLPEFTEEIRQEVIFSGKKLLIEGGIYRSDDPAKANWKGYNAYYNGRLIGQGKITNHGNQTDCTDFAFLVHLSDDLEPWGLATNKDDFAEMADLLHHLFYNHTEGILKRGEEQGIDIELRDIEDRINSFLNCGNITRSQKTASAEDRKESAKGSPKRNTNTATTKGSYTAGPGRRQRGRVVFSFKPLHGDRIGEITNSENSTQVVANSKHPFIEANRTNEPLIVFFAKMAHSIVRQKTADGGDMFPSEAVQSIMDKAGSELAWTPNNQ